MRLSIVLMVVLAASSAEAQTASDEFGIERFRLAMDRSALLDVDWAGMPAQGSWSASAYVGFAHDPLVVYRNGEAIDALVDRRVATGLVGSYVALSWLQLGLGVDLVGYQSGSESLMQLPGGGLGDARAIAKVLAYRTSRFEIAIVPTLTMPGGSAKGYLRESGVTFAPALAVSGAGERLRIAANLGYRMRPRTETAGLVIDDEMFARAGAGVGLGRGELALSLSAAAPPANRAGNQIAVEAMLGGTLHVTRSVDVFAAGGVGLDNGFGTPDWRMVGGVRFASVTEAAVPLAPPVIARPEKPIEPRPVEPAAPPTGTLSGRVVDPEKLPIAGAIVRITPAGGSVVEVKTDGDGNFSTTILAGELAVTVERAEYQPGSTTASLAPKATATISIVLAREVRQGQLRGQVLSFGGKPLEATIVVSQNGTEVSRTNADQDGQYRIELPAGAYDVVIEATGHVTQKRSIKVKLDGVTVLNLDMRGGK